MLAEVAAAVQSDAEADVLVEAAEILVAERARVRLRDRWRPGTSVRITTILGESIVGRVRSSGPQMVVLDGVDRECHAIAYSGIVRVEGVGPALRLEEGPELRVQLTWATWLRRMEVIMLQCRDGWRQMLRVNSVGSDHFDGFAEDGLLQAFPFSGLVQATARDSQRSSPLP